MGSKKHKKESKKRKHRSRSQSPLDVEERERKRHHKKHKDRKKDRSPDVEEVPVDSHLQPAEDVSSSHSRSRSSSVHRHSSREHEKEQSPAPGGAAQESLSIEETNRLRAKLGLKPLEVTEQTTDDGKIKDDLGEFYHKPADNIAHQKKAEKLREKLEVRREKRKLEQKLQTTLLADESDDEDAIAWVKKSREIEEQKKAAEKRAALLDEMDAVFGVSALVQEEQEAERRQRYSQAHLKGLRVAHDIDALGEEREVVLTLADAPVLAEDAEDVLVNVNMVDDERYKKNIVERKKAAAGYQAYDEEAEVAAALGLARPLLAKYDDEIDKDKSDKKKGFRIGDDDSIEANKFRDLMRQERLPNAAGRRLESLQLPALRPATDYLDEHEIQAKFKKPKKKGKMRKRTKAEPIDVDDYEAGAVPLDTDDTEVQPEQLTLRVAVDEEEVEPDGELQAALARARRLRLAEQRHTNVVPKVEELLERVKEEAEDEEAGGAIVLDATAEFCRTLGDIPTYGQAGNRDHHAEIMEMEREEPEVEAGAGAGVVAEMGAGADGAGAWSRVDVHSERAPDLAAGSSVALDAEPALGGGVAGALQLALSKGYLEKAGAAPAPRTAPHQLAARHYSIEDKSHAGEDDKYGRRERGGHSGPLQEFRERSGFRPHVKLEYVDDEGRPLCPKEAFRYLSHKFHGKGPGKNKQEKRIKKAVQEGLMKKMSSTDTPLGTLQMLQEKQRETHSPYVVLSGTKRDHK
ncbi:PREDICTED: U4/U6.U5 tri-snRNP-associated protein 1 [Papilio xuthus]|uniref:U4/U6.U5 tri-snRNP-associated protein 1 n=1 Tax=Papilio xuthus TaxID=66420 RepID=A0AAJ7EKL1_PAPXU|nr:PREDICTED: U4/U6.U5 tri-snRNP-associated protein 1 [Papilio xuthus]